MQPLRNDALRGFSGSKEFYGPAGIVLAGLGIIAITQRVGHTRFDSKVMMTGGAFVTGWLLGGGAISL